MKKNIGTPDRVIRLIFGLLALVLVFFVASMLLKIALIILGIFSIYESLAGWCLFYQLIGKNTCPIK